MAKKGGLGRGLDALFTDNAQQPGSAVEIRISEIEPNRMQPRREFDPEMLRELSESIKLHGILQPLLLRPMRDGYQIVAGERRWRAARMAGLESVPAMIKELDDAQTMEIALIENLQREDLNPLEEAEGYRTLMEKYGMTQEQAALRVGKSRSAVANAVRLLALPDTLLEMLRESRISAGHARTLLGFEDKEEQRKAAELAAQGISVRELERLSMRKKNEEQPRRRRSPGLRPAFYSEVELSLSKALGRKVRVMQGRNKGILEMDFYSAEDLQALANRFYDPEDD